MDEIDDQIQEEFQDPFYVRYARELKQAGVIIFIVAFYGLYRAVPMVSTTVDLAVNPAVAGLTIMYGKLSNLVYNTTGLNIGYLTRTPNPDFIFRVRIATYVNEKKAVPLVNLAVDQFAPRWRRAAALQALLKFDSTDEWIQPFLNELFKGGMLGLYDREAPELDALMKKIRSEGGIRQSLVRAYAEVVLSFMLQVPDQPILRSRALGWLSDLMAEDAIFLIIPRFPREQDPQVQRSVEEAIWNIRAVSDPLTAREMITPYYQSPPWPSLKLPLGVMMARLRHEGSKRYLNRALAKEVLTDEQRVDIRVAMSGKRYPDKLSITPTAKIEKEKKRRARERQYELALAQYDRLRRQAETKTIIMAKVEDEKPGPQKKAVRKTKTPAVSKAETSKPAPVKPMAVAKTEKVPAGKGRKLPVGLDALDYANDPIGLLASLDTVESGAKREKKLPPPKIYRKKSESQMGYVDMVFEVKADKAVLFESPGENQKKTGGVLEKGAKGKATFKAVIGEETWFQVSSKKNNGWVAGGKLRIYDLSPGQYVSKQTSQKTKKKSLDGQRKESTFFEPIFEDVVVYKGAKENSGRVAVLKSDVSYLASKSKKVGPNRWFYLEVGPGKNGWVEGSSIQLSDIRKSVQMVIPSKKGTNIMKESAFAPEWIAATVKGVGVYKKASLGSDIVQLISPPDVFEVLEVGTAGGREWYKIKVSNRKSGWVQALDVSLTSAN